MGEAEAQARRMQSAGVRTGQDGAEVRRRARSGAASLSLAALLAGAALVSPAAAQNQSRPIPETSDDVRRLPIPPIDRSKSAPVVLTGGTLIDGRGGAPVRNAVVVLQGDRIVAAGPAGSIPVPASAARTIDVSGMYILPGLIDLHIHFT